MSQPRVIVCLFSPLGAALVLGPADPPENLAPASSSNRLRWREPTQEGGRNGTRPPDRTVAPSGS